MSTAIAVISGKGGVGKTTTAINLGAALAESGRPTLLIDCDPQANLTSGLGLDPYALDLSLSDLLRGKADVAQVIKHSPVDNLDLIPSTPELVAVEQELDSTVERELLLRDVLAKDRIRERYEFLIFDSPPAFGFHTTSAMAASDYVLIPLQMSGFAVRGLKEVLRAVAVARQGLNPDLEILGLAPTFVNLRTKFSRQLIEGLCELANLRVFETLITPAVALQETALAGIPITAYAPSSRAAAAYRAFANEVLQHV